jgi:hypothetical protein
MLTKDKLKTSPVTEKATIVAASEFVHAAEANDAMRAINKKSS